MDSSTFTHGQSLVSVIIPAKNESRLLPGTLAQFEELRETCNLEVIVSDGGSVDATCAIASRYGAAVVHRTSESQTIGEARNDGAAAASGEFLFFFDADTRMQDSANFFSRMIATFEDPEIVAAIPGMAVFPEQRTFCDRIFQFIYNSAVRGLIAVNQPVSGGQCQVVRATAFRNAGGYPAGVAHGEDTAMLRRIRTEGRIVFMKNLTILESPRRYRSWGYPKLISRFAWSFFCKAFTGREVLKKWERVD